MSNISVIGRSSDPATPLLGRQHVALFWRCSYISNLACLPILFLQGHKYCLACIKRWLHKRSCPYCRRSSNHIWVTLPPQQAKEKRVFHEVNFDK